MTDIKQLNERIVALHVVFLLLSFQVLLLYGGLALSYKHVLLTMNGERVIGEKLVFMCVLAIDAESARADFKQLPLP